MIVFVDDEPRAIDAFHEELKEKGYDVKFFARVDEAWNFIEQNHGEIQLLILDIMMPAGSKIEDKEKGNGLRTGLSFFGESKKRFPSIPIVIFSNVTDHETIEMVEREGGSFLKKTDFLTEEFFDEIKKTLS
jgi:CheY-like chemotaxis protein